MAKSTTTIEGYLSKDPEQRDVTGHTITTVTVPVTPQKKVGDSWEDSGDTVWYTAEFWDEHGQLVMQSMSKGQLVTVTGTLEVRLWESNGKHGVGVKLANPTISVIIQKPKRGQGGQQWGQGATNSGPGDSGTSSEVPWPETAVSGNWDSSQEVAF